MAKSKKRAKALAAKRASKAQRAKESPKSASRYAKKRRGEVPTTPSVRTVWCPGCFCRVCRCSAQTVEFWRAQLRRTHHEEAA